MLNSPTTSQRIEQAFNTALAALTDDIRGLKSGPVTAGEAYQRLCLRELVRGMIAARLLAESMHNPMVQDDLHSLSSKMLDTLALVYPLTGLAPSTGVAVERLGKLGSVSAWKIHTRIMSMLAPQKRERTFAFPFWPASQFKAA